VDVGGRREAHVKVLKLFGGDRARVRWRSCCFSRWMMDFGLGGIDHVCQGVFASFD